MEIEIKAFVKNKKDIEKKIKQTGAVLSGTGKQIDIYYNSPVKNIKGSNEYIRLRTKKGKSIFGYHINKKDYTEEHEIEVNDPKKFKQILKLTGFKELGVIEKKRKKFKYKEFEICLDDVKDIGLFIEIETDGKPNEVKEKRESCIELLEKLGISRDNLCNIWLCDIATGKTKFKKR